MYLCLHLAEFPVQAMLRMRPAMAAESVVVLDGAAPHERVCSASVGALKAGVGRGMTKAEMESFDGVTMLRRSVVEERSAKAAVMEVAATLTPRVEEHAEAGTCVLVLDVSGTERLFGPVDGIARRVLDAVRTMGMEGRIAVSANVPVAVCAARAMREGVWVIGRGEEAAALAGLPVEALGLSEGQVETFGLWGLQTIGELAALPEVDVVVRLGGDGRRLHGMAWGVARHLMVPIEPVFALEEVVGFDAPVDAMESVLFVLGPMLEQLIVRARNRAMELASVTVAMELDGGGRHERTVKPALPVADRALLLKLLHLDMVAHPPGAGVMTLRLAAVAGGRSTLQTGLFSPQMPEPMRLEVTLARIAAIVGEECVGRASLMDSHRPESFQMERFTVPAKVKEVDRTTTPRCQVATRRMRPPVAVRVVGEMAAFHMQGRRFVVRERFGPWRKSGSWWSEEVWSREEWDVVVDVAEGGGCVVFVLVHDLLRDGWEMEAIYD